MLTVTYTVTLLYFTLLYLTLLHNVVSPPGCAVFLTFLKTILSIFRDGRPTAVDELFEVSLSIPQGTLPWQLILWT